VSNYWVEHDLCCYEITTNQGQLTVEVLDACLHGMFVLNLTNEKLVPHRFSRVDFYSKRIGSVVFVAMRLEGKLLRTKK
jgi:hypothetical protein